MPEERREGETVRVLVMRWLSGEIVTQELPIVKAVGQVTAVSDNDCNESAEMVNQDIVEAVADSENDSIALF